MQMPREFQVGGAANYGYGAPTAEELALYDQQEADYYGITLDELRQFRQQQSGFAQPGQDQLPPPTDAAGDSPYVSGINQTSTTADATTQQLLFGLDGEGGFIPGAMQAAESTFFNPDGTPRVVDQEVAGLTPDQLRAMQLTRDQVGIQDRFLGDAESAYREGIERSDIGLERQRSLANQALDTTRMGVEEERALRDRGLEGLLSSIGEGRELAAGATSDLYGRLGETEGIQRGAADQFGRRLGEAESIERGAVDEFGRRLSETESIDRGAVDQFGQRIGETEGIQRGAVDQFGNRLSDVEARGEGAADRFGSRLAGAEQRGLDAARGFGQELGGIESLQRGAAQDFGSRLGESEALIRGTTGAYDQDLTRQFFDPYEDRVVDQTIEDVLRGGDKADMAQIAQDISRGGESAFGSRARLTADERRESLGRGLAKELERLKVYNVEL